MKALLLVAHGSRRAASNDEVRELAQHLAARSSSQFDDVRCAFLELAEPSIPDGLGQCASAGANEIVVLPYFLSKGRHVVEDIPAEIEKKRPELTGVKVRQVTYVGALNGMMDMLLSAAQCSCDDFMTCNDCPVRAN